jgi:hypothetical protein
LDQSQINKGLQSIAQYAMPDSEFSDDLKWTPEAKAKSPLKLTRLTSLLLVLGCPVSTL